MLNSLKDRPIVKLTIGGMFVACGVISAFFYIPIAIGKCFPIQHLINIMCAIFLGPSWGVGIAFTIALLRNLLSLGSVLTFSGSMVGAFLSGYLYQKFNQKKYAYIGEIIGGIIGGVLSGVIASLFLGKNFALYILILNFIGGSLLGSTIAIIILETSGLIGFLKKKLNG